MRHFILGLVALSMSAGCVERAPELSPADRERLREFVGSEAPSPEHAQVVQFDNGVRYLGYDVSAETITPGQPITITWYWHATEDLEDGWQLFTHVADADNDSVLNQDGVGVVRELYQPGRWRAGEYIKDVQEVTLDPAEWGQAPRNEATFYLGLWNGPHRLAIESGPSDGENRIRALSIPVRGGAAAQAAPQPDAPAPTPPPSVRAARAEGITVDGRLDEDAWGQAQRTRPFVNTMTNANADFATTARVLWDDDNLYVAFEVADDFISNTLEGDDAHLWEQDAVEIMVDPDGDGRNYFEMQVSPTGEVFDTRYDTRRQPGPFGHVDWDSNLRAAVNVEGTANDDEPDTRYTAEVAIPWAAFAAGEPPATRPEANGAWRVNLYVMDKRPGDAPMRSAGWSATLTNDFHVPGRFGRVLFGAALAAAPDAPAAGAEGDEAEPGAARPRVIPLPPGTAAALRDSLNTNARVQDPRMGSAVLQDPTTAAAVREAMQQRQERAQREQEAAER